MSADPAAETVPVTDNLTMLRINGWQVYLWRDGDSVTVIDTGAPGAGPAILAAAPNIDRIVLTHGHVDHCGSAGHLQAATGAPVYAGVGDAGYIRAGTELPPPVFEDWEIPIHRRVAAGLPATAPPVEAVTDLHGGEVLDFGGGAEVLAVPGHAAGSIAIHLPRHGVLFTGDTVANVGSVILGTFNQNRAQTVESFRRLAELDADTACFGHGEPIVADVAARLRRAAATLG